MAKGKSSPAEPAAAWEANFREAFQTVHEARDLTIGQLKGRRRTSPTFAPLWISLVDLCRVFCRRPAPAHFVHGFENTIRELLADVLRPCFQQTIEEGKPLSDQEAFAAHAGNRLDALAGILHRLDNPPAKRPRETVYQLQRLPNMTREALRKHCPHLTTEDFDAWEADRSFPLPEHPPEEPASEAPPAALANQVSRPLADALLAMERVYAPVLSIEKPDDDADVDHFDPQQALQDALLGLTSAG